MDPVRRESAKKDEIGLDMAWEGQVSYRTFPCQGLVLPSWNGGPERSGSTRTRSARRLSYSSGC